MDISAENCAMMVRQATGMIVSMVYVVVSTLKRKRPDSETEPEPNTLLYSLRSDGEQHRQRTLQAIYHSSNVECISMVRMRRAPFLSLCNLFRTRGLL
jgi:hypothetical protein